MNFHAPQLLWLLLVPLVFVLADLTRRVRAPALRPKILRARAGSRSLVLARGRAPVSPESRFRLRLWLGLALAIVALARPQWGRVSEPVFDQSREILIALDLSRSMLAPDIRPSRLERAKLLVSSLLGRLRGERVGLIVFAGTAFLQSPLSADYEILREFLPQLNPAYLPQGGSDYEALLKAAIGAFGEQPGDADRYLVILSDGEATDDAWKPLADALAKKNIRVIGLGVGTGAGSMIPDGAGGFVKDERGAVVLSRLESATLRDLADATTGVYADASSWVDLAQIIEATVATGRKGEFREENRVRMTERYQGFLAAALLFLAWSLWGEFPVRPRPRAMRLTATAGGTGADVAGAAGAGAGASGRGGIASGGAGAGGAAANATLALLLALALPAPDAAAAHQAAAPASAPAPASTNAIDLLGAPPPPGVTTPAAAPPAAPLSKLVGELSARDTLHAADYANMARTTIHYGESIQAAQQPVPELPVRDALAAVDAGELLDNNAADWPRLREQLEAFLKKPDDQQQQNQDDQQKQDKQDQQKNDQKQDNQQQQQNQSGGNNSQDQQNQSGGQNSDSQKQDSQGGDQSQDRQNQQQQQQSDPQKNDQKQNDQKQNGQDRQQQQQPGQDDQQQKQSDQDGQKDRRQQNGEKQNQPNSADQQQPQNENQPEPRQGEKAFDNMQKKDDPKDPAARPQPETGDQQQQPQPQPAASGTAPANPGDTQQVGGTAGDSSAQPVDPALVVPLQKLDQIRNQDSPARLFQLMQDPNQPVKKGKDW